jgi:hypothetical protein
MHDLNKAEHKRACRLSDEHTAAELSAMLGTLTGRDHKVVTWAWYLRKTAERKANGWEGPSGYSGRQTKRGVG